MTTKARPSDPFIIMLLRECLSGSEEPQEEGKPFSTGIILLLMTLAGLFFFLYSINYAVLAHYH